MSWQDGIKKSLNFELSLSDVETANGAIRFLAALEQECPLPQWMQHWPAILR